MASINVRSEFYTAPETSNKNAISSVIQQIRPTTGNVSGASVSGDIILDWTTGAGQYCDMYKSNLALKYTVVGASTQAINNLCACAFDRAQLYLNGKKVANSNYFTQDSMLSKRLNFSAAYNNTVHKLTYLDCIIAGGAGGSAVSAAGTYTSIEFLDALFLRTPSLIIPPNTNVRLVLSGAPNILAKSMVSTAANPVVGTITLQDFYMNGYFINQADPAPGEYVMKFITMDTFKNTCSSSSVNAQVNSRNGLVRLSAFAQSDTVATSSVSKIYDAMHFKYVTDGISAAGATEDMALLNIQFKAGQQIIPNSAYDNSTHGFGDSHLQFLANSELVLDPLGGESASEWENQGPIYTVPVVKTAGNEIRNVEIRTNFKAQPTTTSLFFVLMYEQFVSFKYGAAGQPIATESLL